MSSQRMRQVRQKTSNQQRRMAKERQDDAKIGLTLDHNYKTRDAGQIAMLEAKWGALKQLIGAEL